MTAQQIRFVKDSLPAALSAGADFNLNPVVILSQAAFESGWGTSNLAVKHNNFFGLTAYGASTLIGMAGRWRSKLLVIRCSSAGTTRGKILFSISPA